MAASEAVYQFETFTLDPTRGALLDANGAEVPLRAKSFELLRLFVTNAGKLLDRDTINQAIWSNVVVTDDAITQCVRDIRQAIGDIGRQRIIKTVPRRGYIFSAEVACSESDRQRAAAPDATSFPTSQLSRSFASRTLVAILSRSIFRTVWATTSSRHYRVAGRWS
jgi:DNA-binding winged helix-turn-helix (wHTH) protein